MQEGDSEGLSSLTYGSSWANFATVAEVQIEGRYYGIMLGYLCRRENTINKYLSMLNFVSLSLRKERSGHATQQWWRRYKVCYTKVSVMSWFPCWMICIVPGTPYLMTLDETNCGGEFLIDTGPTASRHMSASCALGTPKLLMYCTPEQIDETRTFHRGSQAWLTVMGSPERASSASPSRVSKRRAAMIQQFVLVLKLTHVQLWSSVSSSHKMYEWHEIWKKTNLVHVSLLVTEWTMTSSFRSLSEPRKSGRLEASVAGHIYLVSHLSGHNWYHCGKRSIGPFSQHAFKKK